MSEETLTPAELEKDGDGTAKRWKEEIHKADIRFKRFLREAREANEAYIGFKGEAEEDCSHYMAIFWSNIETMEPALYSSTPKPIVTRRFQDKNPVARTASELLERNLSYYAQSEYIDPLIERDVRSFLRVGLAVDWVRYVADISTDKVRVEIDPTTGEMREVGGEVINPTEIELLSDEEGDYYENSSLNYEEVTCDPVHYKDFRFGHCFTWDECPWVARRVRYRKDAAQKRFGKAADKLQYSARKESGDDDDGKDDDEQATVFPETEIWEIWSKEDKTAYWVSEDSPDLLDKKKDPLGLAGFFPCPRPLIASHTDDSLIPRADFIIYRKQIEYINTLTKRIHLLTGALLLKGVYDAQFPELAELLDSVVEKEMIPVDNFASFMEKGGMEQLVRFMPVEVIAKTLQQLIGLRQQAVQDVYEVTGMSDILRGASDPRETATAQKVKGQFAALRLRKRQREIQRYARDLLVIKAEIIAEHFDPETIIAIADGQFDDLTMQAIELLRDDKMRVFRIDVETDSTIEADLQADKESANELLTSVTGFLDTALAFSEKAPAYAPVMGEFLGFLVRKHRAGRTMEDAIEQASQQYQQQLQQKMSQPPPQDPKAIAAQQEAQIKQQELQLKQQELALKAQTEQSDDAIEREKNMGDQSLEKYKIDLEHARKVEELRQEQLQAFAPPLT